MHYVYRSKDNTNPANNLMVLAPPIAARYGCARDRQTVTHKHTHTHTHTHTHIRGEQTQRGHVFPFAVKPKHLRERLLHLVFAQPLLPTFQLHVWGTPRPFPGWTGSWTHTHTHTRTHSLHTHTLHTQRQGAKMAKLKLPPVQIMFNLILVNDL